MNLGDLDGRAMVKPAVAVYLEVGSRRVFAGALDWPGLCRSGRDEEMALEALVAYGPRYAAAIGSSAHEFAPPAAMFGLTSPLHPGHDGVHPR